jgi:hypothetical protein
VIISKWWLEFKNEKVVGRTVNEDRAATTFTDPTTLTAPPRAELRESKSSDRKTDIALSSKRQSCMVTVAIESANAGLTSIAKAPPLGNFVD